MKRSSVPLITSTPKPTPTTSQPLRLRRCRGLLLIDLRYIDGDNNQFWICLDPVHSRPVTESFRPDEIKGAELMVYHPSWNHREGES